MRSTLLGFVLLTLSCGTPISITSMVVGDDLSCAISGNQTLCWGDGEPVPTRRIFGSDILELLLGSDTYCALLDSGWSCWGSNAQGQFGVSSPTTTSTPIPISFQGDSLKLARFGGAFSCGTTMGVLSCWGAAARGQLGPSVTTSTFLATTIVLPETVREFALGREHACALTTTSIWCWGAGSEGQLGNLDSRDSSVPIRVPLDDQFMTELATVDVAVSLSLGERHSCAQAGSQVRCWGDDDLGQLGQGVRSSPRGVYGVPVGVGPGTLHGGAAHTCTLSTDGVAQCWGDNDKGQLQSPAESPSGPLTVGGEMLITALSLGKEHSCLFSDGQVLCWGSATQGQLGSATSLDTFVPTVVNGLQ